MNMLGLVVNYQKIYNLRHKNKYQWQSEEQRLDQSIMMAWTLMTSYVLRQNTYK